MGDTYGERKARLDGIALRAMEERGLEGSISVEVRGEARAAAEGSTSRRAEVDLRDLPWSSVDNEESLDIDQLTVAVPRDDGHLALLVAVAEVASSVHPGSGLDARAGRNGVSVYAPSRVIPMLPEELSEDATSLRFDRDRRAVVVELVTDREGEVVEERVYPALVRNAAGLAYGPVGRWLEGGPSLPAIDAVPGLGLNIRAQEKVAMALRARRLARGALEFESTETSVRLERDGSIRIEVESKDRAKEYVAECMIAANGAVARFLAKAGYPSLRRSVRPPERWERLVALAAERGARLPAEPSAQALAGFLASERIREPESWPRLSLAAMKLVGAGFYEACGPERGSPGHFALAVEDYAHSTAPNRRYADIVTQRLLGAAFEAASPPYTVEELEPMASRCTLATREAGKVERTARKAAIAMMLSDRVGTVFDAVVTGAAEKGTWVRVSEIGAEGRLVKGTEGLDVGDPVRARLELADIELGHLDFSLA